jgi:hypothetical protein
MKAVKKFFIKFLAILVLLSVIVTLFVIYANFSKGKRAGEVIKMSKKGVIFKTNEGQLNTGGFSDDAGDITSSIWMFSVKPGREDVLKDIDRAIDKGIRVKLFYEEKYFSIFFLGDTKYFVYKVEEVGQSTD